VNLTLNRDALADAASRRGLSLSALFAEAGVSRNALSKVNKGLPVRPSIGLRLEAALARLPELEHIQAAAS
jgi:transcriptional regulator with XRE-family HTH domain